MRAHVGRARAAFVIAVTLAAATVPVAAAAAGSPSTPAAAERAEALVTKFFDLLEEPDVPGLRTFLSPAFVLQRANGTWSDKAAYLEDPAIVESYAIQNLEARRTGPVIVTRYDVVVDSTIDGQQQATDPAPRLSVFVKGDRGWQLAAHSNFNTLVPEPTG
jgi:hypothetical protein